jgi:[acyl-carrier-protein] S-malonyltransferase
MQVAEKMQLRATKLTVAGAFHSPLMQPAADRMAEALEKAAWSPPKIPVMSNVTGQPHDNDSIESIKQRLVDQITHPVRFEANLRWAMANMARSTMVELAPGKVISGLMRRIDRKATVVNHAQPG